jgi:hypothetical protein
MACNAAWQIRRKHFWIPPGRLALRKDLAFHASPRLGSLQGTSHAAQSLWRWAAGLLRNECVVNLTTLIPGAIGRYMRMAYSSPTSNTSSNVVVLLIRPSYWIGHNTWLPLVGPTHHAPCIKCQPAQPPVMAQGDAVVLLLLFRPRTQMLPGTSLWNSSRRLHRHYA